MLKLSLPSVDGFYAELIDHPKVLRVVALSGGYSRDEANAILARNPGMIASFSRALTEGLTRPADRRRVRRRPRRVDRQHLRRLQGLSGQPRPMRRAPHIWARIVSIEAAGRETVADLRLVHAQMAFTRPG